MTLNDCFCLCHVLSSSSIHRKSASSHPKSSVIALFEASTHVTDRWRCNNCVVPCSRCIPQTLTYCSVRVLERFFSSCTELLVTARDWWGCVINDWLHLSSSVLMKIFQSQLLILAFSRIPKYITYIAKQMYINLFENHSKFSTFTPLWIIINHN